MVLLNSQKFSPRPMLQSQVKCFWTLEAEATAHNTMPVLPDTNIELIFNCGAPFVITAVDGSPVELPRVFLSKLHNRPQFPRVAGECRFIAARLYPWAIRNFIDMPADADDLVFIPLSRRWQDFAKTIEFTFRQRGYQEAVNCLQEFTLDSRQEQPYGEAIQSAGETLDGTGGQVDISTLAARSHLSVRQFERQFKYWTGILPKAYARLIRYETARTALLHDPRRNMVALALDHGYTDQAHFIHEFKTFTGATPTAFMASARNGIA